MRYELPGLKLRVKARPLKGKHGRMYMDEKYLEWKDKVREFMAEHYAPEATLWPRLRFHVEMYQPKKPSRGDRDNLAGGLMDALQPPRAAGDVRAQRALEELIPLEERLRDAPGCLYGDDCQIDDLRIRWVKSKRRRVVIHCLELPSEEDEPWVD